MTYYDYQKANYDTYALLIRMINETDSSNQVTKGVKNVKPHTQTPVQL